MKTHYKTPQTIKKHNNKQHPEKNYKNTPKPSKNHKPSKTHKKTLKTVPSVFFTSPGFFKKPSHAHAIRSRRRSPSPRLHSSPESPGALWPGAGFSPPFFGAPKRSFWEAKRWRMIRKTSRISVFLRILWVFFQLVFLYVKT